MKKQVVVIGGGITGLAAAYYLQTEAPDTVEYHVVEAASRLGGKIRSVHENGFLVEAGPDSFLPQKPGVVELCRSLGLSDELIRASGSRTVFIWSDERLVPLPAGMLMVPTQVLPFLRSRLISWPGKLRMALDWFVPARRNVEDESLASFVRRRLGAEALEKIAGPLMAGIYSADPEKLSLQSTFPLFLEMERKHGGLLRGFLAHRNARAKQSLENKPADMSFLTLRGGMQRLVTALVAKLPAEAISLDQQIAKVSRDGQTYVISLRDKPALRADAVIFATPAYVTADLIEELDSPLAAKLRAIRYVSSATVSVGFRSKDLPHSLDGSGFLVPRGANRQINACSWSSLKFRERAPEGSALLRVFIGGDGKSQLAEQSEEALIQLALEELKVTMDISATPVLAKAYCWRNGNPQYDVGHQRRVTEIEAMAANHPGLYLSGGAYHGSGLPDCVQSGKDAAEEIVRGLAMVENDHAEAACLRR